jgi:hypothetical protein
MLKVIDLDRLRVERPAAYKIVSEHLRKYEGEVRVGIYSLPMSNEERKRLVEWATPPPTPVLTVDHPEPVTPPPPQISVKELEAEQAREIMRAADFAAAVNRLNIWVQTGGLEETRANAQAIIDFIETSAANGYWSAEVIDAAVSCLGPKGKNVLTFHVVKAAAKPAPQPAAEVLGRLPNGEMQLTLSAPPPPRSSPEQARDWLARTREASGQPLLTKWVRK